jgi:hypothetical protein
MMSEQRFREMAEKLLEPYVVFREIKHGVVEDVEGFEKVITHALKKVEAETRAESAREIERLKKHIADEVTCYHGSCLDIRLLKAQLKTIEAETVERCAEVADNYLATNKQYAGISRAIRSLIK